MNLPVIDPLIAGGVVLTTALTDAIYVQFTAAVADRRRFAAASWSSAWYLLAAFAIIIASGLEEHSKLSGVEQGLRRVGEVLLGCVVGLIVSWLMSHLWPMPATRLTEAASR